jgi:aspartate racemase
MRTIGLIGGMSWESSVSYYRIINEKVRDCLGGLHSAECLMYSVDFSDVEVLQRENRWNEASQVMAQAARRLERGGADCIVLCTNTMHKLSDAIEASVAIPMLHIADATAKQVLCQSLGTVGLLGTRFTMEEEFYRGRLERKHGLEVLVPETDDREFVHRVIYDELCLGIIHPASRQRYRQIIAEMVERGAQGVILGCTEIGLLVQAEDSQVPLFDTARIHAESAVEWALT